MYNLMTVCPIGTRSLVEIRNDLYTVEAKPSLKRGAFKAGLHITVILFIAAMVDPRPSSYVVLWKDLES